MMQELFRIPFLNVPIYGYGLMMVVGFLCAIQLAKFLAKHTGLDPELFVNAGLLALISGVLGARLSHVLENLHQYTDPTRSALANVKSALNIQSGGLTYYGGVLVATPTLIVYALRKRIPLRTGMDIIAPCLMVGLAFGRIGCFLNGCCYGATCELPWAVHFPYASIPYQEEVSDGQLIPPRELLHDADDSFRPRVLEKADVNASPSLRQLASSQHSLGLHPAQLYSTFTALLIAALCVAFYTLPHAAGRGFALMMIVEGLTRYLLEMLRVEPPVMHIGAHGLSLSMVIGACVFVGGIALWFAFGAMKRERRLELPPDAAILPSSTVGDQPIRGV